VKETARSIFTSPQVIHEPPRDFILTTPKPSDVYNFEMLKTKLVNGVPLNDLVMTWIAARAKVQRKLSDFDFEMKSQYW